MGYADELRAMINALAERPEIVESPDQDQLEANKQTVALMQPALTAIGGSAYWKWVFPAAQMPHGTGNWAESPRETAMAYKRVLAAMLATQDMGKIVDRLNAEAGGR